MNILYLSCHETLEYYEVRMLTEMGHNVYSHGAYLQPNASGKRPAISGLAYNPQFVNLALQYPKEHLHVEMFAGIDAVIVMHRLEWIEDNKALLTDFIQKGGRVIWRGIGQTVPYQEIQLAKFAQWGVELIGYSPREATIKNYARRSRIIRFGLPADDWMGWNGRNKQVINFTQSMLERAKYCGWAYFKEATDGLEAKVYGVGNDNLGANSGGQVDYDTQRSLLKNSRAYMYTGTQPASYTLNFIEAWLTGIPIVAIGAELGNGSDFREQSTYEVHELIDNDVNGFVFDNTAFLREKLRQLLQEHSYAAEVGAAGRKKATQVFSYETIKPQWARLLGGK